MRKSVVLIVLVLFFMAGNALAESGDKVALLDLDAIVVTASKYEKLLKDVPQNVTVITAEEIKEMKAESVADIVEDVVGLQVQPYGSAGTQASVSMRGMTSSQVLVLIDGRRVNKFTDGMVDLSQIPVNNIASIEIVRGAASSLYGSSAMGGVINIITKKEAENEVNVSYGTYNTSHSDLTVSNSLDKFTYTFTAAKDSSKGDRPNSEYDAKSANWYSGFRFSDEVYADLRAGYFNSELGTPGATSWEDYDDKNFATKYYGDIELGLPYGVNMKGFSSYDRLEFEEDISNIDTHTNVDRGGEVKVSRDLAGWNHIIVGGEYHDYRLVSTTIGHKDMQLSSGYLHDEIKISDVARLTFGGRYDSYKGVDSEFSPSGALLIYLPKDTSLRISAGKSFRAPTFNDLYWPSTAWAEGNPDLDPETSESYDVSIDTHFSDSLWLRVGGFYNDVKDMIKWGPGTDFIWRPYNIENAIVKGAEAEAKAKFLKYFTANIGYTHLDTKNKETKRDVIYSADEKIDADLNVTVDKTSLTLTLAHVGKRYHNDPDTNGNRIRLHAYTVYGAKLVQGLSDTTELYIKGENLLDKRYAYQREYPMPGAAMYAGLKVDF